MEILALRFTNLVGATINGLLVGASIGEICFHGGSTVESKLGVTVATARLAQPTDMFRIASVTKTIGTVADDSFENYVKTTFTDPLGIQRLKPSLGNNSVHPGGFIEASYYQRVGWANRGGASASNNGDGVMTVSRHASGAYTASPLDFLRWFSTVDHSRKIYRSLDDTRFSWILDSGLGFNVKELASGVALSKGGLLPDVTHAEFCRRGDGISFIWVSNGGVRKLSNALNRRFDADPNLPLRDVTYDYF